MTVVYGRRARHSRPEHQRARKRLGLSQEDLAARAEIDRTYVSGIERQVRNPTITVVAKFANALETTTADLLTDRS